MGALESLSKQAAKGKKRFFDMRWWSNEGEKWSARAIWNKEYPKQMRKILTGSISKRFTDLGIDGGTAKLWENILLDNQGNTAPAFKAIRKQLTDRYARTLSVSGFSKTLRLAHFAFVGQLDQRMLAHGIPSKRTLRVTQLMPGH